MNLTAEVQIAPLDLSRVLVAGENAPVAYSDDPEKARAQVLGQVMKAFKAGDPVKVEAWSKAYQNQVPNRNMFAIRPHRFKAIFDSFGSRQVPLQQNHETVQQFRGGKVTDVRYDGDPSQVGAWASFKVQAVKEWAAVGILDGTVDRFSMGLNPGRSEGDVSCSIPWCGKSLTTEVCGHWPGREYAAPEGTAYEGSKHTCFMWVGNDGLQAHDGATDAWGKEYSAVVNPAIDGTNIAVPEVHAHLARTAHACGGLDTFGASSKDAREVLRLLALAEGPYEMSQEPKREGANEPCSQALLEDTQMNAETASEFVSALAEAVDGENFNLEDWCKAQFGDTDDNAVLATCLQALFAGLTDGLIPIDEYEARVAEAQEAAGVALEAANEALTKECEDLRVRVTAAEEARRGFLISSVSAARLAAGTLTKATVEEEQASLGVCATDELERHLEAAQVSIQAPSGSGTPGGDPVQAEVVEEAPLRYDTNAPLGADDWDALASGDTSSLLGRGRYGVAPDRVR